MARPSSHCGTKILILAKNARCYNLKDGGGFLLLVMEARIVTHGRQASLIDAARRQTRNRVVIMGELFGE